MHGHLNVKLVHLVGFIIRIYHDARSPERQISASSWFYYKNLSRCTVSWTSNPFVVLHSLVRPKTVWVDWNWTRQLMVCAEVHVRVWSGDKAIMVDKLWALLGANTGVGGGHGVNGEKNDCVFMSIKHNAGPNESKTVGNGSFESAVRSKEHQTIIMQINTKFWRCLLPISSTKYLNSRLLSHISWGNITGFRRTAPVSTVLTGNCTNKCTRFVRQTHSLQFCYRPGWHRHLQGELCGI